MRAVPITVTSDNFTQHTSLDGATFQLAFRWNQRAAAWSMDVLTEDGEPIVYGVSIVLGYPLLRRVFHERRPAGDFIALASGEGSEILERDDLGARVSLIYVEAADVQALAS